MLTAALCILSVVALVVVGWVSYSLGRNNGDAYATLKVADIRIKHIDTLKRVFNYVDAVAQHTRGPVAMKNSLQKFLVNEMNKVSK